MTLLSHHYSHLFFNTIAPDSPPPPPQDEDSSLASNQPTNINHPPNQMVDQRRGEVTVWATNLQSPARPGQTVCSDQAWHNWGQRSEKLRCLTVDRPVEWQNHYYTTRPDQAITAHWWTHWMISYLTFKCPDKTGENPEIAAIFNIFHWIFCHILK